MIVSMPRSSRGAHSLMVGEMKRAPSSSTWNSCMLKCYGGGRYFFGGGGFGSAATGIERAPLAPTERTPKKRLSVETPRSVVSPGSTTKAHTDQRGSVVSRQRTSNPERSGSGSADQETFASGVTPPESATFSGGAGASASRSRTSALTRATSPRNSRLRKRGRSPYSRPSSTRGV